MIRDGFKVLARAFYREHGLALHHIESYNHFIGEKLQQIIHETEVIEPPLPPPGVEEYKICLLYTSPSPRDLSTSRMPSSA